MLDMCSITAPCTPVVSEALRTTASGYNAVYTDVSYLLSIFSICSFTDKYRHLSGPAERM